MLGEVAVIAALAYPSIISLPPTAYQTLCPSASHNASRIQSITLLFALGVFLAVCGSAIRVWCYSVLGRFFTYEITLRPGHKLVRRAPYSIVRHPSYTGLFLHCTGVAMVQFSPGGWIRECGVMRTNAGLLITVWIVVSAYATLSIWKRGPIEDELLRRAFGKQWDEYAHDVPWKFFPWIV